MNLNTCWCNINVFKLSYTGYVIFKKKSTYVSLYDFIFLIMSVLQQIVFWGFFANDEKNLCISQTAYSADAIPV